MSFIKDVVIYKKGETKVYINQCHNKGKKTNFYTVRKNDKTGLGHLLGFIYYSGAWWQYIFEPSNTTIWSSSCLLGITKFLDETNKKQRERWKLN